MGEKLNSMPLGKKGAGEFFGAKVEIIGHLYLLTGLTHMKSKPFISPGQGIVFQSGTGEGFCLPTKT